MTSHEAETPITHRTVINYKMSVTILGHGLLCHNGQLVVMCLHCLHRILGQNQGYITI